MEEPSRVTELFKCQKDGAKKEGFVLLDPRAVTDIHFLTLSRRTTENEMN